MTEPKPFDLQKARVGEAIMFRDGIPCDFIAYCPDARASDRVIVLDYELKSVTSRYENGQRFRGMTSEKDLVMAQKKRKVTVRLWQTDNGTLLTTLTIQPDMPCARSWTLIKEETWEVPE